MYRRHAVHRERAEQKCEKCGASILPKLRRGHRRQRFCSRACLYESMRGERAANWRGGRHITAEGYAKVYAPTHPKATGHGGYVLEHRLVMEQVLGRHLEIHETVHHINGDKADNRPENLQLRSGRHGRGFVHRCADCGSQNIVRDPL